MELIISDFESFSDIHYSLELKCHHSSHITYLRGQRYKLAVLCLFKPSNQKEKRKQNTQSILLLINICDIF